MDDFVVHFGKPSPSQRTFWTRAHNVFAGGSVVDAPHSGRPCARGDC